MMNVFTCQKPAGRYHIPGSDAAAHCSHDGLPAITGLSPAFFFILTEARVLFGGLSLFPAILAMSEGRLACTDWYVEALEAEGDIHSSKVSVHLSWSPSTYRG